jgi:hypothetical protein
MGPFLGADFNLIFSHNLTLKSAFHPNYKGKGVGLQRSLLLVGHICICLLIIGQPMRTGEYEEGGGKGWELTYVLEETFYGAWATPCLS